MDLAIDPALAPMEAQSAAKLPEGEGWQYEPKWDGFRCLAYKSGDEVDLRSKAGRPLARYFPEIVELLAAVPVRRFALDGELAVPVDGRFDFEQLQLRLHPAASRVRKLAQQHPAVFIAFDLLVDAKNRALTERPLAERRRALEAFFAKLPEALRLLLSPATTERRVALRWCEEVGTALDGIVGKRLDLPYRAGLRDGMVKVKRLRSADCVVGGFRYGDGSRLVGSLLLGLYDEAGLLHHVGFTSGIKTAEKPALTKRLERLVEPPGFTGRAPGGPSRWATERSGEWCPLRPELVVEVRYDHVTGGRFRHGTTLLRWRPDKAPHQCRMEQIERRQSSHDPPLPSPAALVGSAA
jgi:ATP-dependent DNA ligase